MEEGRPCSGLISRFNQESALCLRRGLARGSGTSQDFRKITRADQQQHPKRNGEGDPEEHSIEPSSDEQHQEGSDVGVDLLVGETQAAAYQHEEQPYRRHSHSGSQRQ